MRKFVGISLITPDVPRLRAFYEAVLQLKAEGDAEFAAFALDGGTLALYFAPGMERMAPGSMVNAGTGSFTLEFEVADVDAEYARLLDLAVSIVKPPTTQPWGLRSVWFRDPDGNIINFYARVAGEV